MSYVLLYLTIVVLFQGARDILVDKGEMLQQSGQGLTKEQK
jgi:hypothetical protein